MKKIPKHWSSKKCSYCGAKAIWREQAFNCRKYACQDHVEQLATHERSEALDNDNLSEADCQTWFNL